MNINEYLEQSGRTAAKKYFDFSGVFINSQQLLHQMMDIVYAGTVGDLMKRSTFYSDKKIQERADKAKDLAVSIYNKVQAQPEIVIKEEHADLFHAVFGLASETGELAEELIDATTSDREPNWDNLLEELGDLMWYQSLMMRKITELTGRQVDFEIVGGKNIAKLAVRYPDKFKVGDAIERDLEAEKTAMAG